MKPRAIPCPAGGRRAWRPAGAGGQAGRAGTDVPQHEAHHRQAGEVDAEAVAPKGDVVAEPVATSGVSATQPTQASVTT